MTPEDVIALEPAMVSYAQNHEDVRLRRLFAEDYVGFYIDVGANEPTWGSITRYFYDRGWRGINIEPVPALCERLLAERPRDINLDVGLADTSGSARLFESRGLSTFSVEQARLHEASGIVFEERDVELRTLASVCEEYVEGEVDFLSIDVEGYERRVLAGADFSRFRPRAVVVEATRPNTREPSHHEWEDLLLSARYAFAAFDGLNRYYVREEDADLAERLEVGPNVFDNYVPYRWIHELENANARASRYRHRSRRCHPRRLLRRLDPRQLLGR